MPTEAGFLIYETIHYRQYTGSRIYYLPLISLAFLADCLVSCFLFLCPVGVRARYHSFLCSTRYLVCGLTVLPLWDPNDKAELFFWQQHAYHMYPYYQKLHVFTCYLAPAALRHIPNGSYTSSSSSSTHSKLGCVGCPMLSYLSMLYNNMIRGTRN